MPAILLFVLLRTFSITLKRMTKCLVGVGNKHVQDLSFKSDPLQYLFIYLFIYVGSPILGRVTEQHVAPLCRPLKVCPLPTPHER